MWKGEGRVLLMGEGSQEGIYANAQDTPAYNIVNPLLTLEST
jgi:hypothetical protein